MSKAHFSEDEIQHLFQRAAALQAEADDASHPPRLSSAELETIAEQAGIAPRYVRQAIAAYQHPEIAVAEIEASLTHVFIEQLADAPLTDDVWDGIVSYLRLRYDTDLGERLGMTDAGRNGYGKSSTEQSGSARYWTHVSMLGIETRVSAIAEGTQTRLMLSRRVGIGGPAIDAGLLGALPAVLVFLSASQAVPFLPALLLALVMLFCATGLAYGIGSRWRSRQAKQLSKLAETLATRLAPARPASPDQGPPVERIAPDEDLSTDAGEAPPAYEHRQGAERRRARP